MHLCDSLPEKRIERYMNAWHEAYAHAWRLEASGRILLETGLTLTDWFTKDLPAEKNESVKKIWGECNPMVSGLVCGFAGGMGIAFYSHWESFPCDFAAIGFAAIGSGSEAATRELGSLNQHIHRSLPRTLYNVCMAMDAGAREQPASVSNQARYAIARADAPIEPLDAPALRRWTSHVRQMGVDLDSEAAFLTLRTMARITT